MHWIALRPRPEPSRPELGSLSDADGPPALVDALSALGWWALQFTPKVAQVAIEEASEECNVKGIFN